MSSVTFGATTLSKANYLGHLVLSPESVLQVTLVLQASGVSRLTQKVAAVADTWGQVCVAGPALVASLGFKPAQLQRRLAYETWRGFLLPASAQRSTASGSPGAPPFKRCTSSSVERMYLSFTTCKELCLVQV